MEPPSCSDACSPTAPAAEGETADAIDASHVEVRLKTIKKAAQPSSPSKAQCSGLAGRRPANIEVSSSSEDASGVEQACTASDSTAIAPPTSPLPPRKTLSVMRVEVHRITAIVENDDTFVAQIFVKLAFKGMANDKHLTRLNPDVKGATLNTPYFPLDKDCNPTFKPNAAWYLEQLVFDNMAAPPCEQLRQRDAKVKKIDDDLVLEIYTEGKFYEKYELQDFPFDAQDLTFHLTLNVQVDGKLGMDLDIDDGITRYISQDGFMLADRWSNRGLIGMPILCYALQFDPQGTSDDDISSTPRRVLKVGTEAKKAFQAENKQRQFASWSRSENKQRVSSSE